MQGLATGSDHDRNGGGRNLELIEDEQCPNQRLRLIAQRGLVQRAS